jgi:hypothetical protein
MIVNVNATHIAKKTKLFLKYRFATKKYITIENEDNPFAIQIDDIFWDLNSFRPDFRDDKEFMNTDTGRESITVFEILKGGVLIPRIIVWNNKKFTNTR